MSALSLYDIVHAPGVAIDLNHIDTPGPVDGFLPADDGLHKALTGADLVVITAGIARKPGMTRDRENLDISRIMKAFYLTFML